MKTTTKKLWLLSLGLLFTFAAKAQTTCASAATYTFPVNQTVTSYTDGIYWFKVTLDTGAFQIQINNTGGVGKIVRADVYTSSTGCGDTTLIETDSLATGATSFTVQVHDTIATTYYLRLHDAGGSTTFNVQTVTSCSIWGQFGYCAGQAVTLNAFPVIGTTTTTATYTWSTGAHTQAISPTPTVTTTYSVSCLIGGVTYTSNVTVYPLPNDACNSCQLVQNGAFENNKYIHHRDHNIQLTNNCGGIYTSTSPSDPVNWTAPTCGTPDYFNVNEAPTITTLSVTVPTNFQATSTAPHSGNGYAGFITYSAYTNSREYIQEKLKCALVSGQLYNVSFYTSWGDKAGVPGNNIGAYLSTSGLSASNSTVVPNVIPQVNAANVINNAGSWTQVAGTIIGAGEQYITLGNFYDDYHTLPYNQSNQGNSYYFVDDISVMPVTPTIAAGSCQSGSVTLTAYGAASANTIWSGPSSFTATGNPIIVPSPTGTASAVYTCTLTLSSCTTCPIYTATYTLQPATTCSAVNSFTTPVSSGSLIASPAYMANNVTIGAGVTYTINCSDLRIAATKSITVVNTATLTIMGSWLHACNECSSTSMWQGIVVNNGGTLIMTESISGKAKSNIIEDAVQAVYTSTCVGTCTLTPKYNISSTIFNNNTTAIYVDKQQGDLSGNYLYDCVFTSRKLSSHNLFSLANIATIIADIQAATPLHPSAINQIDLTIAGARSKYGVYVNGGFEQYPVNVGRSNGAYNLFDNLDYGIYGFGCNVAARNNVFQNHTGNSNSYPGVDPIGVGIYMTEGGLKDGTLLAGNSTTTIDDSEKNSFTNCLAGIVTKKINHITINNNSFNNETTATTFTTANSYVTGQAGVSINGYAINTNTATTSPIEQMQIANNTIQNYATGCFIDFDKLYNTNPGSAGGSGYIYQNAITGAYNGNQYCNTGIYMQQGVNFGANTGVPQDAISVSSNTITNVNSNAVAVSAVTTNTAATAGFVTISGNTELSVKYSPTATTTTSPPVAAVYITGSKYIKVSNNPKIGCTYLTGAYPNTNTAYLYGVYVNQSPNSRITCNAVSETGVDFAWVSTNTGCIWEENNMLKSRYGLVLASAGVFGDQGNASQAAYNTWGITSANFSSSQTYVDGTSNPGQAPLTSKLYGLAQTCTPAPSTPLPCSNGTTGSGTAYIIGGLFGSLFTVTTPTNSPGLCTAEGGTGRMAANGKQRKISSGQGVAGSGQATADSSLLALLNFADTLPAYTQQTRWATQYYVSAANSNIAAVQGYENARIFALADGALAGQNYSVAQNLVGAVAPTNVIESNWQTVDNIIIKLHGDTLNQSNINSLQNVAAQCPLTGGSIVWKARALLNNYYGTVLNFPNPCPAITFDNVSGERIENTNTAITNNKMQSNAVKLYPNPNNGSMVIEYSIKSDAVFEITDMNGKLISKYNLPASATMLNISNIQLENGVYFYRISDNNTLSKTGKIIIMK